MRNMSRRSVMAALAASGLAGGLAACAPPDPGQVNSEPVIPAADGPVTLQYWAWVKDLQKVCDIFNAKHDRITVEATWITSGGQGGYAKILSAVAAGGGPDIAQIELNNLPEFALAGALVDLGRYGYGSDESAYNPSAIAEVKVGDAYYGAPQDTGPMTMFYNHEVLVDELGLEPPATWQELRDVAREVKSAKKSLMSLDPTDGSVFLAWAMQAGAVWFKPEADGWIVNLTDDASLEVAEFWDQLLADRTISTSYGPYSTPWYSAAGDGKILSTMTGSWGDALLTGIPNAEGKWRVAAMPRWSGGYGSGRHGGSSAAVISTSKHPAEATEFVTWLTTDPEAIDAQIEHCGIGWSPSADYIGESRTKPSEFFGGQNYNEEVVVPMAEDQNLDWTWAPLMQRVTAILGDGFASAVSGSASLVDVMANTQEEIAEIMRGMGLDVEESR